MLAYHLKAAWTVTVALFYDI